MKRIVVGARYGLKDWLVQRVTAVVMALYLVGLLAFLLPRRPFDAAHWQALLQLPGARLFSFIFFVALCWHAWIGVRDILMDYIQPVAIRLTAQVVVILVLLLYVLWAAEILWGS